MYRFEQNKKKIAPVKIMNMVIFKKLRSSTITKLKKGPNNCNHLNFHTLSFKTTKYKFISVKIKITVLKVVVSRDVSVVHKKRPYYSFMTMRKKTPWWKIKKRHGKTKKNACHAEWRKKADGIRKDKEKNTYHAKRNRRHAEKQKQIPRYFV